MPPKLLKHKIVGALWPYTSAGRSAKQQVTPEDIDRPSKSVRIVHCTWDPTKGLLGLPDNWRDRYEDLQQRNNSETAEQHGDFISGSRSQRVLPPKIVVHSDFKKCLPDAQHDLAALEVLSDPGEPDSRYDIQEIIGGGAYGKVFSARERVNGRDVAIKQCNPQYVTETPSLYLNELIALKVCKHRNVVSLIASYMAYPIGEDSKSSNRLSISVRVPFLVMELMETSLYRLLTMVYPDERMPETMATFVMREVLTGMAFLHTKGVLHRDIKSDNVLLSRNGEVKIADFGLSCRFAFRDEEFQPRIGTCLWMPPEMILDQPYTFRADIWSLGITFIELLDGAPPYYNLFFGGCTKATIMSLIVKRPPARPKRNISPELKAVFEATLRHRPEKRRSCSSILAMPALQNTSTIDGFANYLSTVLEP